MIIRGLTLRPPWPLAVSELTKSVENRSWRPPSEMIGEHLAIHTGKAWDGNGADHIAKITGRRFLKDECRPGHIVAVCRLTGCVKDASHLRDDRDRRWACPRLFKWLLSERVALKTPIPCMGAQGLWRVPSAIVEQLDAAVKEAFKRGAVQW